jgi:hypothetical protein
VSPAVGRVLKTAAALTMGHRTEAMAGNAARGAGAARAGTARTSGRSGARTPRDFCPDIIRDLEPIAEAEAADRREEKEILFVGPVPAENRIEARRRGQN